MLALRPYTPIRMVLTWALCSNAGARIPTGAPLSAR